MTLRSPFRQIVGVVEPSRLHADGTATLASAPVFQISRNRRHWIVVAGTKGIGSAEVRWHSRQQVVVSGSPTLSEVRPHRTANADVLIPAVTVPAPVDLESVSVGVRPADRTAPDPLEPAEYIEVGDRYLQPRRVLNGVLAVGPNAPLPLKESGRPSNLTFGWHEPTLCHDRPECKTLSKFAFLISKEV